MKHSISITSIIALILSVLLFGSCKEKRNLHADSAKAGVEICERIIFTYNDIQFQSFMEKKQNELITILLNPKLKSEDLPKFNQKSFITDYSLKIEAFKALRKVYHTYDLISDKKYNTENLKFSDIIIEACLALDTLNLSDDIKNTLSLVSDEIKAIVTARKFDEKIVVSKLTDAYLSVWNSDIMNWKNSLNEMYNSYSNGLEKVPFDVFDEAKISKFVYEPYQGKEVLVNIYKMNLKNEAFTEKQKIIEGFDRIALAMETINRVHLEFSKKHESKKDIMSMLDKIDELLYQKKYSKKGSLQKLSNI